MYIIITGGNSGIGFEATRRFLQQQSEQHFIIWGCRNQERAEAAKASLPAEEQKRLSIMPLELSDFDSVRQFARDYESLNQPLDCLILNAGIMSQRKDPITFAKYEGLEETLITNHFGHFLLTLLLLPLLQKQPRKTQIIVVASTLHDSKVMPGKSFEHVDWENMDGRKVFDGMLFYRYSKLFNASFNFLKKPALTTFTLGLVCV